MEAAIHSVSLGIKGRSSWTLVVYNITNGVEVSEVEPNKASVSYNYLIIKFCDDTGI